MQIKADGQVTTNEMVTAERVLLSHPGRQVVTRTFFSLLTIYLISWAALDSDSRLHTVLATGGTSALVSAFMLMTAGLAALLDVVFNDILPSRFSFYLNRKHRHGVWGLIALTYMGYAQVFSKSIFGYYGAGFYTLLGLWAAVIAAMDVWYEYIENRDTRNAAE